MAVRRASRKSRLPFGPYLRPAPSPPQPQFPAYGPGPVTHLAARVRRSGGPGSGGPSGPAEMGAQAGRDAVDGGGARRGDLVQRHETVDQAGLAAQFDRDAASLSRRA